MTRDEFLTKRLAERGEELEQMRAERDRLSGGLVALAGAPKTVGSSVLRSVAYDIAMNCIDAETAEFQIKRRAGIVGDQQRAADGGDDLEHIEGMLEDREREG